MGGSELEVSKYVECAKCEHLITCKVKEDKAEQCINFKERVSNEPRVDKITQANT